MHSKTVPLPPTKKAKTYHVTMVVEITATSVDEAESIGEGAIEHLRDTFNDDESIGVGVVTLVTEI